MVSARIKENGCKKRGVCGAWRVACDTMWVVQGMCWHSAGGAGDRRGGTVVYHRGGAPPEREPRANRRVPPVWRVACVGLSGAQRRGSSSGGHGAVDLCEEGGVGRVDLVDGVDGRVAPLVTAVTGLQTCAHPNMAPKSNSPMFAPQKRHSNHKASVPSKPAHPSNTHTCVRTHARMHARTRAPS